MLERVSFVGRIIGSCLRTVLKQQKSFLLLGPLQPQVGSAMKGHRSRSAAEVEALHGRLREPMPLVARGGEVE